MPAVSQSLIQLMYKTFSNLFFHKSDYASSIFLYPAHFGRKKEKKKTRKQNKITKAFLYGIVSGLPFSMSKNHIAPCRFKHLSTSYMTDMVTCNT